MEITMKIDTKFGVVKYVEAVNAIVEGYFDANGKYQPHMGLLNAMCVFYNMCVKESKYDDEIPHNMFDSFDLEALVSDQEFEEAFQNSMEIKAIRLDFANAFRDAIDIVNEKKGSTARIIEVIRIELEKLIQSAGNVMTEENMAIMEKIAKHIKDGNLDVDKFIETYGQSEMFKRLLSSREKNNKK